MHSTDPAGDGKPPICVLEPIHQDAMEALRKRAVVVGSEDSAAHRWPEMADAIIVRNATVTGEQIARAKRLRVIGKHGAGTDTIDTDKAAELDIPVVSTPGVNAPSVADLALAMALSLARNLQGHTMALRQGAPLSGEQRIGFEMSELPAGIIGLGAIGRAVASRLLGGFGVRVKAFDPGIAEADWPSDIGRAESVESLLKDSRMLFLHVGLNRSTQGMISTKELAAMPENSFVINCSRGGVVDEAALFEALSTGQIAGAASDVFEQEPPPSDHPLLQLPGFIATPHVGASTDAGLKRTGMEVIDKVFAVLNKS